MKFADMEKIVMSWKAKINQIINQKLYHKLMIVPILRNLEIVNMEKIAMS